MTYNTHALPYLVFQNLFTSEIILVTYYLIA